MTDHEVLVIRVGTDIGFLGGKLLFAEISGDSQRIGLRDPRASVPSRLVGLQNDGCLVDRFGPGGDSSVEEDQIAVDGHLDADQSIGLLFECCGDNALGDRIGEAVRMAWETYSACWYIRLRDVG